MAAQVVTASALAAGAPPEFWARACAELAEADSLMHALIYAHPKIHLVSRGDCFGTLARAIVGQQISVKAAQSVWNRVLALTSVQVTAAHFATLAVDALRGCGLSVRKAEYLIEMARAFESGRVRPARWAQMDDEAVIDELTELRGVGRWTAEMLLMFNLLRPDVLPLDDIGLLRAVGLHYGDGERAERALAIDVAGSWRPWRSVATWYLWRSLEAAPVEY
jgi:DNA-3-methyladenine glycosylase II